MLATHRHVSRTSARSTLRPSSTVLVLYGRHVQSPRAIHRAKGTSLIRSHTNIIGLVHRSQHAHCAYTGYLTGPKSVSRRRSRLSVSSYSTSNVTPTPSSPTTRDYIPPPHGILSRLPRSWVPYAELSRLDKPVGTYYLFLPCVFSTLLAAPLTDPISTPTAVLGTSLLFFTGSIVMRGAGCTINDLWDRNLDPHVARTRLRPLARRAVTPRAALVWAGAQCLAGLGVLVSLPPACFVYAAPSLVLVALYPLAKRVTDYPQFVLGLTFSWGAFVGFPALGLDVLRDGATLAAVGCLYASNVAWTVLYDMVYAHMDIKDDAKVGIRSIARRHERETKVVLAGLAVTQAALLGAAGWAVDVGWVYYIGVCGSSLLGNGVQIWRVKLDDWQDCWWWFRNGVWITGGAITLGLTAEYAMRYLELYRTNDQGDSVV